MQKEFAAVRATPAQVRDVVRERAPVRAGFLEFARWCDDAGHRLIVFSNGFRSVIEPVLDDVGLAHLEVVSHDAAFSGDGCRLIWSERGARCTLCGRPCKRQTAAGAAGTVRSSCTWATGSPIGASRCSADVSSLGTAWPSDLAGEGVAFEPFDDFDEVRALLDRRVTVAS